MTSARPGQPRRPAEQTRQEIRRAALDLFIANGYRGTSVRDIADALGITPAALYYHFKSKEDLATSLLGQRRRELDELADWIEAQPRSPDLVRRAALRWIDNATPEQLQGIRFAHANHSFMERAGTRASDLRAGFDRVIDALASGDTSTPDRIRLRMIMDALPAALHANEFEHGSYDDVLLAARAAVIAFTSEQTE